MIKRTDQNRRKTQMKHRLFSMPLWCVLLGIGLVCVMYGQAYAEKTGLLTFAAERQARDPTIVLSMGKADIIDIEGPVSDVMIANPSIARITIINPNRLYIAGLNLGDTNIIALDSQGDVVGRMNVHVKINEEYLQKLVEEYFPNEDIKIRALLDQIILSGTVSTPAVATRVQNFVMHAVTEIQGVEGSPDEYLANFLEVRGEQQVMLRVRIVEASRDVLKELGIQSQIDSEGLTTRVVSSLTEGAGGLTLDPLTTARLRVNPKTRGIGILDLALRALAEENMINILAEPNLTAISGEQAGFLAGGEFPVPDGRDLQGNIKVQYRQFGVSLNFIPRVLSQDRISLHMDTEVSSLDFTKGLVTADTVIPALDVRRAGTTVELPSGGSLMIAGILRSDSVSAMSGLPGIMKTPVLGKLVSSERFERRETELLIIVTPYLVQPYGAPEVAREVPSSVPNPLAVAFRANIERLFGRKDEDLFEGEEHYGYLLQ